jgi:putative heme-binding domain-containing protein
MAMICSTLTILIGAVFIGGYGSVSPTLTQAKNELARGEKLFVAHCALCHGIGGTGGRGPSLNQPQLRRAADSRALLLIIRSGIQGTEMPGAWQMTDREIGQVADYVKSLGRTEVIKLPGDRAKGKEYYEAKAGCAACHIVRGQGGILGPDLTDIGARRSAAYLREALTEPGAAVPEGFLVVSVSTRDGQKVRGIRSNEDSFTIQIRDAKSVYHSFRKRDLTELNREFDVSLMPGYRDVLAAREIDDVVAYLASLRGEK